MVLLVGVRARRKCGGGERPAQRREGRAEQGPGRVSKEEAAPTAAPGVCPAPGLCVLPSQSSLLPAGRSHLFPLPAASHLLQVPTVAPAQHLAGSGLWEPKSSADAPPSLTTSLLELPPGGFKQRGGCWLASGGS